MDLGTSKGEPDDGTRDLERIEPLIYPWLFRKVSRYWYDATLLMLTGLIVTIVPGIFVAVAGGDILAGLILGLSGATKVIGYMIGFLISKRYGTEIGEWSSGGLRWACAGVAWIFIK